MLPSLCPMLAYEDGVAAMRWLSLAFGFEIRAQWVGDDGRLEHGELERGGQSLLIASPVGYLSPATRRARHPETFAWYDQPWIFDGVLIWVEHLEPVLEVALGVGAKQLAPVEEGFPGRRVRLEDPEGHRWFLVERSG